ncbi:MAG: ECF transporter S component [Clostridia bacterium]|nr:ECF transporter S component [Clostridia bacterium]
MKEKKTMVKSQTEKTVKLTQLAFLIALIIIMTFTPIGYIPIGPLKITLLLIPVVLGAILLGPSGGTICGFAFGMSSFITCFTGDAFGAALVAINPFYTFITCVVTRTIMGYLTGLLFKKINKDEKVWPLILSSLVGVCLNTLLFMSAIIIFFKDAPIVVGWMESLGTSNLFMFVILAVGVNFLVELLVTSILSTAIAKVIIKAFKKTKTA